MAIDPEAAEVKASGGVVWRRAAGRARGRGRAPAALRRLVVPEGQARPRRELGGRGAARGRGGDRAALPARRRAAADVSYRDHKGRAKVVRYWMMEPLDGEFVPHDEVDEMRWLAPADAGDAAQLRRTTASCCARSPGEPRPLPRACATAGRGSTGRPARRWSTARSTRWPTGCAPAATPTTAACSRPRTRTDELVDAARAAVGALLGGDPRGVAFGPSMTGDDDALRRRRRPRAASPATRSSARGWTTTPTCGPWLIAAERAGAEVRFAEPEPETLELPAAAVEAVLTERTRWVAVTAASNAVGTVPDLPGIVAAAHAAGARVYVDAVHAAPHRRLDVAGARLRRARLLGLQVVRPARRDPVGAGPSCSPSWRPTSSRPSPDAVPDRWELGTLPFESLAGVRAAADYVLSTDWDAVREHEESLLAGRAGRRCARWTHVTLYGDAARPRADADVQRRGPHRRRGRRRARRARDRGLARQLLRVGARAPPRARAARRRPRRLRPLQRRSRRGAAAGWRSATSPGSPAGPACV